jgi:hypothetical protein
MFGAEFLCGSDQPPMLLLDAPHCLVTEKQDWLGLRTSKASKLSLGYVLDSTSFSGKAFLYGVVDKSTDGSQGNVFDIEYRQLGSIRIYNIQNNATFARSRKGVDFLGPPLGGTWTQDHLLAAVKKIGQRPRFDVRVNDLLKQSALTRCSSYADDK